MHLTQTLEVIGAKGQSLRVSLYRKGKRKQNTNANSKSKDIFKKSMLEDILARTLSSFLTMSMSMSVHPFLPMISMARTYSPADMNISAAAFGSLMFDAHSA